MKTFERWSASQVDTYLSCNRKWWFNKILGLEIPQHPSAAIGSEVHAQIEGYLEGAKGQDTLGPIARTAIPFMPEPGTVNIESSIEPLKLTAAGLPALGYIDVHNLRTDPPEVLDWKTTSDLRWAKSEDDLQRNVQMTVYAKATLATFEQMGLRRPPFVRLTHVAMVTKPPHRAQRTSTIIDVDTIEKNWATIEATVADMKTTALATTPDRVTPNETTCGAYGGCAFRDRCRALKAVSHMLTNDNTGDTMSSTDQAGKASLLAKLAAKKAGTAAPATPAPAAAPTAPAAAPPEGLLSRLRSNLAKPTPPTSPVAPVVTPAAAAVAAAIVGILPPDAPSDEKVAEQIATEDEAKTAATAAKTSNKDGTVRRPRNAAVRLEALGYPADVIASMSNEAMHTALDGNVAYAGAAPAEPAVVVIEPQPKVVVAEPPVAEPTPAVEPAATPSPLEPSADARYARVEGYNEGYKAGWEDGYQEGYKHAEQELRETIIADVRKEFAEADASVPRPTGLQLYIDCRPVSGALLPHHALEDLLAPLMTKVAENAKVAHYSLIPYAQGPAQVAALLTTRMPTGVVVCDTRLPATNAALEALLPYAALVVRGR